MPGQTLSIVQVMIVDDSVYEGIQDFSAVLTTTDSSVNIFEPDATAQITDDDGKTVADMQITRDICYSLIQ